QPRRRLTAVLAGHLRGARGEAARRRPAVRDARAACPAPEGARGAASAEVPDGADLGVARDVRGGRRSRVADPRLRPGLRPAHRRDPRRTRLLGYEAAAIADLR